MGGLFASEQARISAERLASREQNYSAGINRPRIHGEDAPRFDPGLDSLLDELDKVVAAARNISVTRVIKPGSAEKAAATFRLGSIAGHRPQRDFYARLAASPAVRTICEVGFVSLPSGLLHAHAPPH
eukprot:2746871-Prymnesium_polylepis.1